MYGFQGVKYSCQFCSCWSLRSITLALCMDFIYLPLRARQNESSFGAGSRNIGSFGRLTARHPARAEYKLSCQILDSAFHHSVCCERAREGAPDLSSAVVFRHVYNSFKKIWDSPEMRSFSHDSDRK